MSTKHLAASAANSAEKAAPPAARIAAPGGGNHPLAAAERWSMLPLMERSDSAIRHDDGTVSIGRDQRAIWFLYGPFWRLAQGLYRLLVLCRAGAPEIRTGVVLGVEIIADARIELTWRDFTADELTAGRIEIDFVVPPQLSRDAGSGAIFEFRLFHFANAELAVSAVELSRRGTAPVPAAPRRWRLSGRIAPRLARPPDISGFVALRRWAPAGQFLLGVGPVAGLPAGQFQLRFRCRLTASRRVGRPLLCVEIVNGPLVHKGYFYAAELAFGRGSLDFVVPVEFSMEGGTSTAVAVKFLRVRHAGLAIGDIELVQIGDLGRADDPASLIAAADGPVDLPADWPLAVDPVRLRLPPGPVGLSLYARSAAAAPGGNPTIGVELRRERRILPWPRFAGRTGETIARRLTSPNAIDPVTIELAVPASSGGGDGGEAVELRVSSQGAAEIAIGKLVLKQYRRAARKNLTIVGNCHASIIYEGFRGVPTLERYFRSGYYNIDVREHFYERARSDLETCDVLIVQDIGDWEDCPLRAWVADRTEIIRFPAVWFASLWPFDGCNGPTDPQAIAQEAPNFTFTYLDGLLARLRREIPDKQRRFAAYCSLDVVGLVDYRRLHQFEARRMLALDKRHDSQVGRFILDRFQSEQLFYTTNHPNRQIFEIIIADIMRKLSITGEIPTIPALDQLHTLQVPVHPLVAAALGVGWATAERKYRFRQEELTWEEYVRRYIDLYG